MKNFTLLLTFILFSAWSHAEIKPFSPISEEKEKPVIENKLKRSEIKVLSTKTKDNYVDKKQEINKLPEKKGKKQLNYFEPNTLFRNKHYSEKTYEKLDSILVKIYGEVSQKMEISYNDEYNETQVLTSNRINNEWFPIEEKSYEYDEEQNIVTYYGVNHEFGYGDKYEYEYDNKRQNTKATLSTGYINSWQYSQRREFTYDENGNNTGEYIEIYNGTDWEDAMKVFSEYDEENRQVYYESYSWEDSWVGIEKIEQEFYRGDTLAYFIEYIWDYQEEEFIPFQYFRQEFEEGRVKTQTTSFWNEQLEEFVFESQSVNEYDETGKLISEKAYLFRNNEWIYTIYLSYAYEELETGELEVKEEYGYANGEAFSGRTIRYNPQGLMVYDKTYDVINGNEFGIMEFEFSYDEQGNMINKKQWVFMDNIKYADIQEIHTYNENNDRIVTEFLYGQGTGDEDWIEMSRAEYVFNNGINTEQYTYFYDTEMGSYRPNLALGDIYDFDVPSLNNLIVPMDYDAPFKLLSGFEKYGNEEGTGWVETFDKVYYWSEEPVNPDPEPGDGIELKQENNISVYPNPASDYIYVKEEFIRVTIMNISGQNILEENSSPINISGLTEGIYFIKVDTQNGNFIQKIMIKR